MAITIPKILFPFWTRDKAGNHFYDQTEHTGWSKLGGTNTEIAENHPILTPGLLFIGKLFSQAEFYLENRETGKRKYNSSLIQTLWQPNYFQTKEDFLETLVFSMIAEGKAVVWLKRPIGLKDVDSMYILNPNKITYPSNFKTEMIRKNEDHPVQNQKIIYDEYGDNIEIPIKDLLFFYDLPNGLDTNNMFETRSRIDGLKQTLRNTNDSLIAKNIILKTNGKELVTSKGDKGFPLTDEEKASAEKLWFNNYGLGKYRRRGLITKAALDWKSLHVALRDLGLDESTKVDANIVFSALHIPKDILSLEAKKTTYNNFKESMVSYIQNEIQPTLNSVCSVLNRINPKTNWILKGNYDSMPIMKFVLIEKYDGLIKKGQALQALRSAGLPDEVALEEVGMDNTITLNPLIQTQFDDGNTGQTEGSSEENSEGDE